ncbi:MAG: redoxin domain-containing protein [Acidobacteriaceae bacterium]|nr:redoxin domain-containing protein [Acidobacteriaceae bacterium]
MHRLISRAQWCAFLLLNLLLVGSKLHAAPQTYGQPATPRIVGYVELALQQGDLASAAALVGQYRRLNGDTPEALEAFSWLARGELAAGDTGKAMQDAEEITRIAQASLSTRKLDAEPYLPLALGAAYEVKAEVLEKEHKRSEAIQLLRSGMVTWRGTSLVDRLQKAINLLTLQGKPMPVLREAEWIGTKPNTPAEWRGRPLMLFFWAHWCADCKAEAPIITQLAEEFEPKGLVVIAPTRLYGYTAQNENAPVAEEKAFIEKVFDQYYASIPKVQVPLDAGNFARFGVSTTPTIVLVDRHGVVQLYHPGVMDEATLRSSIGHLLVPPNLTHNAAQSGR